jgi:hypothetical protein
MMGMYRDNQKLDREKFDAWKNALNNNSNVPHDDVDYMQSVSNPYSPLQKSVA